MQVLDDELCYKYSEYGNIHDVFFTRASHVPERLPAQVGHTFHHLPPTASLIPCACMALLLATVFGCVRRPHCCVYG